MLLFSDSFFKMSQNQKSFQCSKPIAADLAQLACTWQAVPISSALIEVGVPQLIPADGSGVDVVQIAQQANVDADLLYKYMRFVSTLGIFKEMPNRHFAHNESSKMLLPGQLTFYRLLFFGSTRGGMLTAAEYVTQLKDPSKSAFEHAFKMPFWQHIAQTPELEKHFSDFMTIACNQVMLDILKNTLVELPDTGIVVYVGGGQGNVLFEFLKAKPELTGIIYEMPTMAMQFNEGLKNPNPPSDSIYSKYSVDVKKRVSIVADNYTTDFTQLKQLANADVFFFKLVFHNNNDAVCNKILAGLYQVMKPTAKIILCEVVIKHSPNEWKLSTTLDLNLPLQFNEKVRTKEEWIQLLSNGDGYQYNVSFGDCTICPQIWEMELITLFKRM